MIIGTTTEVHLDEVEAAVLEEEVGILLVVAIKTYALTSDVAIEHRATGISSCIAVDARLQSLLMDIVSHRFQSVGETGGMNQQMTVFRIATTKVSVIDIDMVETYFEQSFGDHCIGLTFDNILTDIHAEGVPRTPAHRGPLLAYCHASHHQGSSQHDFPDTHSVVFSLVSIPPAKVIIIRENYPQFPLISFHKRCYCFFGVRLKR